MNIKDDPKIIQWYNINDLSEKSQGTYLIYMKKFCSCVGKSPSQLIKESEEETRKGLLLSERKTMEYITKYKQCIKDLAPKSQSLGMAVVKSFYEAFDIQLSSSIRKQKKSVPKRENQNFLKKEDVEKMVTYAQNTRDKAIFLCMATSGMGAQETTSLRMSDIVFGEDGISTISIRRKKRDTDLITFISPEATQALKEYIEERNRDTKLAVKGKNDFVFVTYLNGGGHGGKKGGKISERAFSKIFKDLGNELGYGNGEDFVKTRSHALRKFFTSTLESAGFPKPKIDFMVGHTLKGVDLAYYNRDPAELKELYIKYLHHLTFFDKTIEVRSLDTKDAEKLDELEKENLNLKAKIEEIEKGTEVNDLKAKMESSELIQQIMDSKREMEFIKKELSDLKTYAPLWQKFHDKNHGFATGIPDIDMTDIEGQERLVKWLAKKSPSEVKNLIPPKAK
ncbi:MAG: site-specific integrase, partial [Candidatus Methanoperedens sp.]|nr:site-specific integrase [Candidatus Methanoperedens sp.]